MDAKTLAWQLYVFKVQRVMNGQHADFMKYGEATSMTSYPPTPDDVKAIEKALDAARKSGADEATSAALRPVIQLCDALDNSRSKSPVRGELKDAADAAYEALRAIRKQYEVSRLDAPPKE